MDSAAPESRTLGRTIPAAIMAGTTPEIRRTGTGTRELTGCASFVQVEMERDALRIAMAAFPTPKIPSTAPQMPSIRGNFAHGLIDRPRFQKKKRRYGEGSRDYRCCDQRKDSQGKERIRNAANGIALGVQPGCAPEEAHGQRKDAIHHHENGERDGDATGEKHQAFSLSLTRDLLRASPLRDSPPRSSRRLASTTWRRSSSNCASRSVRISTRKDNGNVAAGLASINCRNASPATCRCSSSRENRGL